MDFGCTSSLPHSDYSLCNNYDNYQLQMRCFNAIRQNGKLSERWNQAAVSWPRLLAQRRIGTYSLAAANCRSSAECGLAFTFEIGQWAIWRGINYPSLLLFFYSRVCVWLCVWVSDHSRCGAVVLKWVNNISEMVKLKRWRSHSENNLTEQTFYSIWLVGTLHPEEK